MNRLCHKMAEGQVYFISHRESFDINNCMPRIMACKKQKETNMTEKEKHILNQELWALVLLDSHATKHSFEIMQKMLKCVSKEDANEMTPNKRKVIEELQLQWRFVRSLHEDLGQIAEKLGQSEIVPTIPELSINDRLWETNDSGSSDALYEVNDKISDFQSAIQECTFKLQETCE